ncbi:MAG TPA: HNH endonuclease signature motif containing protein, partial [Polyangiaceae bacterium]
DRLLQSLLAEGYSTLLELVPECSEVHDIDGLECSVATESNAQAAWCAELGHWRSEAEELCKERVLSFVAAHAGDFLPASARHTVHSGSAELIDRDLRRLCAELSKRDLALGLLAESAHKADVWRRLGFATELSYVRERLGVSLSCLKAKRILASRAARVPELAAALSKGRIGYEAAYLLSRVVTQATAEAWIARAERRTVKHLREEVEAAELLIRTGAGREQRPLDEQSLDLVFELERGIMSGDWFGQARDSWAGEAARRESPNASQMSGSVPAGDGAIETEREASQMSGTRRAARIERRFGRVTLRWRVTDGTYRFWHALERIFARVRARVCREPASFLRFLCENFCRTWLPALRRGCLTESGELPEYFRIYRRDAFRCSSPVCRRRDVTPHHLVFRSHGGGHEDDNVASLCSWCHLHGVHEGRIGAEPPASRIRWRIGRSGTLRIDGRALALG